MTDSLLPEHDAVGEVLFITDNHISLRITEGKYKGRQVLAFPKLNSEYFSNPPRKWDKFIFRILLNENPPGSREYVNSARIKTKYE